MAADDDPSGLPPAVADDPSSGTVEEAGSSDLAQAPDLAWLMRESCGLTMGPCSMEDACEDWARRNGRDPQDRSSYQSGTSKQSAPKGCSGFKSGRSAGGTGDGGGGGGGGGGASVPGPNAPNVPSNPNPGDGATGVFRNQGLSWSGGDPDGGYVGYDLHFGTTNPPPFVCHTGYTRSGTACSIPTRQPGTVHYWQVKAMDDAHTTTGPVWSFTTTQLPATPSSPTPADGASNVGWAHGTNYIVRLEWSSGDPDNQENVWYHVKGRIGNSGSFSTICHFQGAPMCDWVSGSRGILHEWFVEAAKNSAGTVTGPVWSFTTKPNTPPGVCLSLFNSNLDVTATNGCSDADGDEVRYTFDWNDGTSSSTTSAASSTSLAHHYVGAAYCPSGTATVTLTAWDGYDAVTGSQSIFLDGDGQHGDPDDLINCREDIQGTSTTDMDTDDDGLNDYVESAWWPGRDTVFCIPGNTATSPGCAPNPLHKDVYVEMDYVTPTATTGIPSSTVLGDVVAYFQNAPLQNPDGTSGIHLHLDAGQGLGPTYADFNLRGGNDVGTHTGMFASNCLTQFWQAYDDTKNTHFGGQRNGIFHYALWMDRVCPEGDGIARSIPGRDIAIQGYSPINQQHDFLHELGHGLGLDHGGNAEVTYKPNYLSAMNYRRPHFTDNTEYLGYSTRALPTMNEATLDERVAFAQGRTLSSDEVSYLNQFKLSFECPDGSSLEFVTYESQMDFDCDTVIEPNVVANVNGHTHPTGTYRAGQKVGTDTQGTADPSDDTVIANDCLPSSTGGCDVLLAGHEDWPAIQFNGLSVSHGYGQWNSLAHPDGFITGLGLGLPEKVCVPWPAGGQHCTNLV